jgi:hypothetical protein
MKRFAVALMAVAIPCLAGVGRQVLAQEPQPPLAEVARKEAERRKAIRSASPVYTNADIKATGRPAGPATPAPAGAASGQAGEGAGQPTAPTSGAAPAGEPKAASGPPPPGRADQPAASPSAREGEAPAAGDEAFWRRRMAEARERLQRSKLFAEALQSRINALWADFTARDDPAQRAIIEANRQEALAELERVKADIERETRAIEELEEEARKAGVPPGWLR